MTQSCSCLSDLGGLVSFAEGWPQPSCWCCVCMTQPCPFSWLNIFLFFCCRCQESPHCPRTHLVPAAPPAHPGRHRWWVCGVPAVREVPAARAGEAGLGRPAQACWPLGGRNRGSLEQSSCPCVNCREVKPSEEAECAFLELTSPVGLG